MRNKHSMGRRFLALLLCALMMVGLMPTTALAATTTVSNATDLQNAIKNAGDGDTIKLGGNITFSGDSGLRTMTNLYQNKQVTYELTLFREVTSERYVMSPVWTQVSVRDDGSALLPDSYKRVNIVTGEETGSIKLEGRYNPNTVREHGDATAYLFIENKNLTIDLNGYTISGSRKDAYLSTLFVTGSSKVTIMDSRSGGRITSSGSAVTAHGKDAKVTIKSGSFQGDQSAVAAIYNGTIDIQGGSFTGYSQAEKTVTTYHSGEQTIEGVMSDDKFKKTRIERDFDFSITRTRQSGILFINSGGTITVSGKPAFQIPGSGNLSAFENGEGSIKISGGTFNTPPKANEIASGYCILYKDGGTCEVVPVNDSRVVARVRPRSGYTSYCTSLSEAIKLAQDGDMVTLLKNISEGQNLNNNSTYTLDLGGNTINGNVTVKTGKVTIKNGTINYTGTGNALKTEGNSAVLTADCTVSAPNGTALKAGYGGQNGGTVNAIGGTYTGKLGTEASGTLTITGGRYKDDPSAYLAEGLYAILDPDRYYMVTDTPFIQIWNKDDLLAFVQKVNAGDAGANAVLMADINLSGVTWTPIKNFSGSFNGNGHSITNFISTKGGLFDRIEKGGVVSNVTIKSGNISGGGGAIAYICYGTIQGCFNYASVSGTRNVGGIVGGLGGNVERCGNYGEIKGETSVGGIVGQVLDSVIIKNCYNTGSISATKAEKVGWGNFDGTTWENYHYTGAGGICGPSNYSGRLISFSADNCFNYGTISANNNYFVPVALNGTNNWHLDTTAKNCAIPGYASKGSNKSVFASGDLAYTLNGGENGVWYQNIGEDPYPVLDPTHARVYWTGTAGYVNYTYQDIGFIKDVTVPGGTPVAEITSQLAKTVQIYSDKPGSLLRAELSWDTSPLSNYDPDNWEKQTFTLNGTAYVTGLKNGGAKSVQTTVTVNPVTVYYLNTVTGPKTKYSEGDSLDLSKMKVEAVYNDANKTIMELSYDSPGVTCSLEHGTVLNKQNHNGHQILLYYGGKRIGGGSAWALNILSTDNTIQSIKIGDVAAVKGEDGEYIITLPKGSSLPEESNITVTPTDSSVKSVTKSLVEGSNNYWEITVVAESGSTATYYLEVFIDGWNEDAIDSLKQAWEGIDKTWKPTQAEVQQGPSKDGDDKNPSYEVQLKAWLLQTMVERGLEIPRNVDIDISFTQGPDWATAGDRHNDRDGEDGKFEFSITFTATQGSEDTHKTVTFDSQSGIITATPYEAPDYTVHFNSGGGSPVDDLIVKEDDVIGDKAPTDPTFEHYTFLGWFTEQTGGEKWDMANDKVTTNNMTLYAHWELTKYKVVLPENQHGYTLEANKEEVVWNETVTFTYKLGVGYNGDALVIKVNGTQVTPDKNGQFTVGGNVDSDIVVTVDGVINAPTYTVTIPESVNLDSTATVSAAGVNVAEGSSLYVAIGGKFSIANSNPLFNQTIGYPIQKGGKGGTQIQPDDTVLTVAGGIANNTGSQVLYFGLPTEEPKYADDYKGTVTFRIGIKDTE